MIIEEEAFDRILDELNFHFISIWFQDRIFLSITTTVTSQPDPVAATRQPSYQINRRIFPRCRLMVPTSSWVAKIELPINMQILQSMGTNMDNTVVAKLSSNTMSLMIME